MSEDIPLTPGNTDWTRGIRQDTTTRNNGQQNNNKDYVYESQHNDNCNPVNIVWLMSCIRR